MTRPELRSFLGRARESTLVRNTMALYGVHLSGLVLPLVTIPYLARVLRPEGWGLVVFAQSFAAWLALLLEFGFYLSATRMIARVRGDRERVAEVVAGVQRAKGLLLLALLAAAGIGYAAVPILRENPSYLFWILSIAVAQGFSVLWYFQGMERMRGVAMAEVLARGAAAAGIFVWVRGPGDGWRVLALQALTSAVWVSLSTFWMYREVRWVRVGWHAAVEMIRSASGLFLFRSTAGAYNQANPFILGLLAGPQAVGFFGGAERVVRAATSLIQPVSQALYPRMSHLAQRDPREAARLIRTSLLLVGGLGAAIGAVLAVGAPFWVGILLGEGYGAAVPVLRLLALLPPVVAVGTVLGIQWALPMGYDRPFYALVFGAAALNVALAVLLAPMYGARGMAAAVVVAEAMVAIGLVGLSLRKDRGLWARDAERPRHRFPRRGGLAPEVVVGAEE